MTSCGEFGEPRLIHGPGFIQLCTDRSGDLSEWGFLSSGNDGDVWLWGKEELDDVDYTPRSAGGRTHNAVAWHGKYAYVGHTYTDPKTKIAESVVSKIDLDDISLPSQIISFSLDVTTVDISPSGTFLVAGAIDHNVKVFNLNDETISRIELDGQILCVLLDPKEEFLAVTSSSGNLRTYKLPISSSSIAVGTSRLCSRIVDIDLSRTRLQCSWSPNGEFLLAPSVGCIKRFNRGDFNSGVSLSVNEIVGEEFSVCCVSPCGKYAAASALSGVITVWNISEGSLNTLSKYTCNQGEKVFICSMIWSRTLDATIFFADTNEHLCTLSKCIKSITAEDVKVNKIVVEDDDDNNTRLSEDLGAIKKAFGFNEDGLFIGKTDSSMEKEKNENKQSELLVQYKPPVIPPSFVSGSTPTSLNERYIKWNRFGVISCYTTDSEGSIEARWHDASIHSVMSFDNSNNYTLGDISNEVLALGSKINNDGLSELYTIYIGAWSQSSREWRTTLSSDEVIDDVLIGADFVAIITSNRCFRTFTLSGTQRLVVSFPGVLITACAINNELALATYFGGCFFEENCDVAQYNVIINRYKIDNQNWFKASGCSETIPAVVGRGQKLVWMGHSREGEICLLDSKYCLRLLTQNKIWIPIYDFSSSMKSQSDGIWPIGVVEKPRLEIRYIYCKGTTFPLIPSKPVPLIVECKVPLCNPASEKSKIESDLLLTEVLRSSYENKGLQYTPEAQDLSSKYAKDVVRLFALSCKADRECRAEELAWLTTKPQILQSLCNFAAKTHHALLSEKVAEIGRRCNDSFRNDGDAVKEPCTPFVTPSSRTSLKVLKKSGRRSANIASSLLEETVKEGSDEPEAEANTPSSSERSLFDLTMASENSTQLVLDKSKPPNPFKRKIVDVSHEETENTFDNLSLPDSDFCSLNLNKAKRAKELQPSMKQSVLSFTPQERRNRKTGFALWLESCEGDLKKEYSGDSEGFMSFATKRFRSLSSFEKQTVYISVDVNVRIKGYRPDSNMYIWRRFTQLACRVPEFIM
uniref:WD_REPEATS_REGION domain-containing protein n=1 Tax=Syphacia muris TaxID=451379 RepID=A0A158R4X8_9BILA